MIAVKKKSTLWLLLLLLVLSANIAIYNTALYDLLQIEQNPQVVLGSLVDFMIVAPILAFIYLKRKSWKTSILLIAAGCLVARFVIPSDLLSPYKHITTAGIALELGFIVFELAFIGLLMVYLPKIIRQVKASSQPVLFAFPSAIQNFSKNKIINIFSYELLVFYYAFASWKGKQPSGITLHKGTSYIALQLMLMHAIILESVGLHWWLHGIAPVAAFILLLLNIYGVIFLLADMRVTQLNPIRIEQTGFYISRGLLRRAYIDYRNIEEVVMKPGKQKASVEFMTPDFETPVPDFLLKMKSPQRIDTMYGMKKYYDTISIKCDDPAALLQAIEEGRGQ